MLSGHFHIFIDLQESTFLQVDELWKWFEFGHFKVKEKISVVQNCNFKLQKTDDNDT